MAALPYFQFFTGDWLRDTRFLSPEAKGCWVDTLAVLWDSKTRGLLSHPVCGWARLWGIQEEAAENIINQLSEVAEVQRQGELVYIISRRMVREELEREDARNRKRKERNQVEDFRYKARLAELSSQVLILSELCPNLVTTQSQSGHEDVTSESRPIPETRDQSSERDSKTPKRAIPSIEDCEQAARNHSPEDMHEFAASVAREFHGVFSSMQPPWVTRGGDDLTKSKAWIHKLRTKLEQEFRNEISRRSARNERNQSKSGKAHSGGSRGKSNNAGSGIEVKSL